MNDTQRRLKELFRGIAADARKIAQSEIAAEIATLIRGGKVLWSALPYPKAGTTNTGADAGHVGAMQPDGVTILLDPETGIISTGGDALPPGTLGDLIYFDGTNWVVRHRGDPTNILYMDPTTLTPIWQALAALAAQLGPYLAQPPVPTTVVLSDTSARALLLWNGGGNDAPPPDIVGTPWTSLSYIETGASHAWANALIVTAAGNPGNPLPDGSHPIWYENGAVSLAEECIFRHTFTVAPGTITSVSIHILAPLHGVWLNGQFVPGSAVDPPPISGGVTLSIPATWLLPNSANVLAVFAYNDGTAAIGQAAWLAYKLSIS